MSTITSHGTRSVDEPSSSSFCFSRNNCFPECCLQIPFGWPIGLFPIGKWLFRAPVKSVMPCNSQARNAKYLYICKYIAFTERSIWALRFLHCGPENLASFRLYKIVCTCTVNLRFNPLSKKMYCESVEKEGAFTVYGQPSGFIGVLSVVGLLTLAFVYSCCGENSLYWHQNLGLV